MPVEQESNALKNQIRAELHVPEAIYEPGESVHAKVGTKSFTGVIGPFGIGKTTIVDEALRLEPSLAPINTTTTRQRKSGDPSGFTTAEDGITFTFFREAVKNRQLVNYSVIPDVDIYGTFPEDFPAEYTIGPFLPAGIRHIEKARFKSHRFIYLVASGELWREFIEKSRRGMPDKEFQARAHEALDSIRFAERNSELFDFVENTGGPDGLARTAYKVAQLALFHPEETLSRETAVRYLAEMSAVAQELIEG